MQWWREARFGMFIHWGVYAVPAGTYKGKHIDGIGEWIMRQAEIPVTEYRAFARQFNPVKYDPEAWAALAEEAGMKYMVITSKHHDGFALFPSDVDRLGCRRGDTVRKRLDRAARCGCATARPEVRTLLLASSGLDKSRVVPRPVWTMAKDGVKNTRENSTTICRRSLCRRRARSSHAINRISSGGTRRT